MSTATAPPQALIDLQQLTVSIRRRRRLWLSAGLAGLLLGLLSAVLLPAKPTAVTRVLVIHEDEQAQAGESLIKTDIALLATTRIAEAALKNLGSSERPEDFLETYKATALTNDVLELTVSGSNDADAVARARALADAFIADHVQRVRAAAQADAQAVIDRRTRVQEELAAVDASIAAMSPADRRARATELEALYGHRSELLSQINDLSNRAEEAGVGAPRVAAGTQIVDQPRAKPRSLLKSAAVNGGIGFVLALTAGLALAAIGSVVRDRPVLRQHVAEHIGASVLAQLPGERRLAALLPGHARRRRRIAATLARAVSGDAGPVSLLELGARRTATALAIDLATVLANHGPVLIVDDLTGGRLARRLKSPGAEIRIAGGAGPARDPARDLASGPPDPSSPGRPAGGAADRQERRIGLGSVRPGSPWTDLPGLGAQTLLVVRAGHASALWLHTVARQLVDLQIPVIGVVLVDPDRRDRSDGTLWDGLHTALRGRAGAAAAPSAPDTPAAGVPDVTLRPSETTMPGAPLRRTNGASGAAPTDDHPTDVLGPIWPAAQDIEGRETAPRHRSRRWRGPGG